MTNSPREGFSIHSNRLRSLCLCIVTLWLQDACANDAYYSLPVSSLTFTDGALPPNPTRGNWRRWQTLSAIQPYAVLDGEGEAYLGGNWTATWSPNPVDSAGRTLSVRAPENKEVTGRLFVLKEDSSGMIPLRFRIPAADTKPDARRAFLDAKEQYYRGLLNRNIAGGAWFRHQLELIAKERGAKQPAGSVRARTGTVPGRSTPKTPSTSSPAAAQ